MKKESGMSKVGGWLAGIAGAVIATYLGWYFTRTKPTPPPPPPPAVTTFEGMVYSDSGPVPKAMVVVDLTGVAGANGAIHDVTDDSGAYKIELTGLPPDTGATLSVKAKGFEGAAPKVLSGPLQSDVRVDIGLSPVVLAGAAAPPPVGQPAAPPPAGQPAAQPGAAGQPVAAVPGVTIAAAAAHKPFYRPKSAAMAMKFQVPVKQQQ